MAEHIPAVEAAEITESSFAEIVRRHESMVFSIALHFVADRSAAEELAQATAPSRHGSRNRERKPNTPATIGITLITKGFRTFSQDSRGLGDIASGLALVVGLDSWQPSGPRRGQSVKSTRIQETT
jgi:hypothetical protein